MTRRVAANGSGSGESPGRDRVTAEFDWAGDRPASIVVLETLAEAADRDVESFEPLYDVIDVDALDALFQPRESGQTRGEGRVSFQVEDYFVSLHSDGLIAVERTDD